MEPRAFRRNFRQNRRRQLILYCDGLSSRMAKKRAVVEVDRGMLVDCYLEWLFEHGAPPASVVALCRHAGIGEKDFYRIFPSFQALEASIWCGLVDDTVAVLEADDKYPEDPPRQKMAAFYYTFLETALERRSFLLLRFQGVQLMSPPRSLRRMQDAFQTFASALLDEASESGQIARCGKLSRLYPGLLYLQLLFVLDFWLKDDSEGFQRTDALVEKSIALTFDLLETRAIDSAIDFVRFLSGIHRAA